MKHISTEDDQVRRVNSRKNVFATTTAQHQPHYRAPNRHHTTNNASKNIATTTPSMTTAAPTAPNSASQSSFNTPQERVAVLQKAGRDLGFELPQECYEGEKWEFEEWIEEQGKRR